MTNNKLDSSFIFLKYTKFKILRSLVEHNVFTPLLFHTSHLFIANLELLRLQSRWLASIAEPFYKMKQNPKKFKSNMRIKLQ